MNISVKNIICLAILLLATNTLFAQEEKKPFNQRSYYKKIFTSDELKTLKKADKTYKKGDKWLTKGERAQNEVNDLNQIINTTSDKKTIAKANKKKADAAKDMYKYFDKAHTYLAASNKSRYDVYVKAIPKIRKTDTSYSTKVAMMFEKDGINFFSEATKLRTEAAKSKDDQRLEFLNQAYQSELYSASQLEYAMHGYVVGIPVDTTGKKITLDNRKEFKPLIKNTPYDINKDDNLYRSRETDITAKAGFSADEQTKLTFRKSRTANGDDLMRETEDLFLKLDVAKQKIAAEKDQTQIQILKQEKSQIETNILAKQLSAVQMYIEANESKYQAYKSNLPKHRPAATTLEAMRGTMYETEAENLFMQAQSIKINAFTRFYRHETYSDLVVANEILLNAIEKQEKAYGLYLGFNAITMDDIELVSKKNTPVTTANDNKTTNTQNNTANTNNNTKAQTQNTTNNTTPKTNNTTTNNTTTTQTSKVYEVESTSIYSTDSPSPTPIVHDAGAVFKVQVGVLSDAPSASKFGTYQPVTVEKLKNTNLSRYLVGKFGTIDDANKALIDIRKIGYDDAFVMAYIAGKRMKAADAVAEINKNPQLKTTTTVKNDPVPATKTYPTLKSVKNNITTTPGITNSVTNVDGFFFTIQFEASKSSLPKDNLKYYSPVFTDNTSGDYKYSAGMFQTLDQAKTAQQQVQQNGHKDAFIIAYNDGQRLSLNEADKVLSDASSVYATAKPAFTINNVKTTPQTATVSNNTTNNGISFQVQIATYKNTVPQADINKFNAMKSARTVNRYDNPDGSIIYTVGNYPDYNQAANLKTTMINEGYKDCFVTAYNGTQKISVADAKKMLRN